MSIGIDGIAGLVDQTGKSAADSRSNALQNKLGGDLTSASDEKLRKSARNLKLILWNR